MKGAVACALRRLRPGTGLATVCRVTVPNQEQRSSTPPQQRLGDSVDMYSVLKAKKKI